MDKVWAQKITHSIMQWANDYRKKFTKPEFIYLSKQIVNLFPSENEVCFSRLIKYCYSISNHQGRYFKEDGKKFSGFLFDRYKNTLKKDGYSTKRKIDRWNNADQINVEKKIKLTDCNYFLNIINLLLLFYYQIPFVI